MSTSQFNIGLAKKGGRELEVGLVLRQLFGYLDEPISTLRTLKIVNTLRSGRFLDVSLELPGRTVRDLYEYVYALADSLGLEGIAVRVPNTACGVWVGPRFPDRGLFDCLFPFK